MDVQDFAERLLGSPSLEEKLRPPPRDLSWTQRRPDLQLARPVRPADVRFAETAPLATDVDALESSTALARLFHRFLDHELLAVELLALAIHRFAEAPEPFRRELLTTLVEEQTHVRLYLDCLRSAGGDYGSYPWTTSFWRLLSEASTPMAFVCGMSLGLEQANLDFAGHYLKIMGKLGHEGGVAALNRVLADEVRHVRRGLKWFRTWKEPGDDEFQAWTKHLPGGFSPGRAKGLDFSSEIRREAGLEEGFIRRLRTLSHSRGRRPDVYVFNPDCEADLTPRGRVASDVANVVARDLEVIPLVFASKDDLLLVSQAPAAVHLEQLADIGFPLPEVMAVEGRDPSRIAASLGSRALGRFIPWGASPRWLPLAPRCDWLEPGAQAIWSQSWEAPFRKSWPYRAFEGALAPLPGRVVETIEDVGEAVADLRRAGASDLVLKADLGSAGRAMTRVFEGRLDAPALGFARRVLDSQGRMVVEPWHRRVLDVSGHGTVLENGRVRWDGLTRFFVDARGRYRGTSLSFWCDGPRNEEALRLRREAVDWERRLRRVASVVGDRLARLGYTGVFSFDAYVHRLDDGDLALRELVEINPRHTMGRVALRLRRRRLAPGVPGAFFILGPSDAAASPERRLLELVNRLTCRHRAFTVDGSGGKRLSSGVALLTPVTADTRFAAIFVAGRSALSDPVFAT